MGSCHLHFSPLVLVSLFSTSYSLPWYPNDIVKLWLSLALQARTRNHDAFLILSTEPIGRHDKVIRIKWETKRFECLCNNPCPVAAVCTLGLQHMHRGLYSHEPLHVFYWMGKSQHKMNAAAHLLNFVFSVQAFESEWTGLAAVLSSLGSKHFRILLEKKNIGMLKTTHTVQICWSGLLLKKQSHSCWLQDKKDMRNSLFHRVCFRWGLNKILSIGLPC